MEGHHGLVRLDKVPDEHEDPLAANNGRPHDLGKGSEKRAERTPRRGSHEGAIDERFREREGDVAAASSFDIRLHCWVRRELLSFDHSSGN